MSTHTLFGDIDQYIDIVNTLWTLDASIAYYRCYGNFSLIYYPYILRIPSNHILHGNLSIEISHQIHNPERVAVRCHLVGLTILTNALTCLVFIG